MSSPPEVLVHKYGSYCWRAKVRNWLVKFCEMILTRETKVSYSFTATTMEPEVSWNILLRASPAAPPKGPQTGYGGAGAKKLTQSLPQNQKVASLAHQFSRRGPPLSVTQTKFGGAMFGGAAGCRFHPKTNCCAGASPYGHAPDEI